MRKAVAIAAMRSALIHLPIASIGIRRRVLSIRIFLIVFWITVPIYFYGIATFNLFYQASANAGAAAPAELF